MQQCNKSQDQGKELMSKYVDTGLFPLSIHLSKSPGGGTVVFHFTSEETEAHPERQSGCPTPQDSAPTLISFHSQRLLSLKFLISECSSR